MDYETDPAYLEVKRSQREDVRHIEIASARDAFSEGLFELRVDASNTRQVMLLNRNELARLAELLSDFLGRG